MKGPFFEREKSPNSNTVGTLRIRIFDIVGRQVYSGTINTSSPAAANQGEVSINTHSFSKGTYILELISADGGREIRKIVK